MIYQGLELYNVHQLLEDQIDDDLAFTRIPNELRVRLNDSARLNALQTTGAEARFNLLGERAVFTLRSADRPSVVEVYQGSFLVDWQVVGTEPTQIVVQPPDNLDTLARLTAEHHLPYDAQLTRLLLPWRPPARLLSIEGQFEPPRADQTPASKYLAYGSSITHGNCSARPSAMYAHRTAQFLGMDLINLGFGGGAHLEPQMADYIAARDDWELASLEMGVNILRSIDSDEFARRVGYFVPTIARAHPDKWLFCIDLFTSRFDWELAQKRQRFAQIVRETVAELGMEKVVYIPGAEMLRSVSGLTADLVHPAPAGMEEIARNLTRVIRKRTQENLPASDGPDSPEA